MCGADSWFGAHCEAHVGAHVTALVPPALLLLALCPALDGPGADPDAASTAASTAAFTCWLMKIVITSAYCGAGISKIVTSARSPVRGIPGSFGSGGVRFGSGPVRSVSGSGKNPDFFYIFKFFFDLRTEKLLFP